jgi:hypothetical protein
MTFRDGIRRDVQAKRQHDAAKQMELKVLWISNVVTLTRTGQMSDRRCLEEVQRILNGNADRVVRVGEEFRPDIQTGETR